ncbi:unnamed protein product [Rotaria sordida]|uniref:Uncharacterized protein n=1 Tax=Rotaria sordida TaxID=392033 RepID=A0A814Z6W2_9BILA|nr:unnamed protein product [Rotaria sordida]
MNPTWMAVNIVDELQSYENPPPLSRDAFTRKRNRILQRGTVKDRPKCGAPITVRTENFKKMKWNEIVNTDFSGIFTTEGFHNSKNNVINAEDSSEIPADLREAPMLKYPKGVMFWSGICTRGLILHDGPNNFTQWFQGQHQNDKRKRIYMIGELYARFLREEVIPTINKVVQNLDEVIFQDD